MNFEGLDDFSVKQSVYGYTTFHAKRHFIISHKAGSQNKTTKMFQTKVATIL